MGQQTGELKGMREMDRGFCRVREAELLFSIPSRTEARETGLDSRQCSWR